MTEEEERVVKVGWVSLSRSRMSLTINVLNQRFFVSLRDLDSVLNGDRKWADVKQWVEQRKEEWEEGDEWSDLGEESEEYEDWEEDD